jgi:hypothetical protein
MESTPSSLPSLASSAVKKKLNKRFSLVQVVMTAGIVFCILDILYIVRVVMDAEENDPASSRIQRSSDSTSPSSQQQEQQRKRKEQEKPDSSVGRSQPTEKGGNDPQSASLSQNNKEPIYALLREAGVDPESLGADTLQQLPSWDEVTRLYGDRPILVGLDTCERFRQQSDPAEHLIGVAGTFNTGTNLLAELLIQNCYIPERTQRYGPVSRGMRWQVPYGKHTPIVNETYRLTYHAHGDTDINTANVLVAAAIRDPAVWAPSMCRHEYAMEWTHDSKQHCPNLIATQMDVDLDASLIVGQTVPVSIQYAEFAQQHASMLDHYSDYYKAYYRQAQFPRLLVRFEDLIFFPKQVITQVCECAGGKLNYQDDNSQASSFQYVVESAKKGSAHGTKSQKTGYVDAIIKYGTSQARWRGMLPADLEYAKQTLDPELLAAFHYLAPPTLTE